MVDQFATVRLAESQHRPISSGIASTPHAKARPPLERVSTPSDIFRHCECPTAERRRIITGVPQHRPISSGIASSAACWLPDIPDRLNTVRYLQALRGPLAQGQISSPLVRHSARGADNRGFRVHRCRAGDAHLSTHLAIRLGLG